MIPFVANDQNRQIYKESRFTAARDWDGTLGERGDCCWIWDLFWGDEENVLKIGLYIGDDYPTL